MVPKTKVERYLYPVLISLVIFMGVSLFAGRLFPLMVSLYAESIQQTKIQITAAELESQFQQNGWQQETLQEMGQKGLVQGLIISVKDGEGKTVWDGAAYADKESPDLLNSIAVHMKMLIPGWQGKDIENEVALVQGNKPIGTLMVRSVGPYFLTSSELIYFTHIYRWVLIITVSMLIILVVMVWQNQQKILLEIQKITELTKRIEKAQPIENELFVSRQKEIDEVLTSIKNLAEQIAEQEKEKARITDDLAHELRTPLTTLQANLEIMVEGLVEATPERLHSCHEEILRIIRLVGELEQLNKYQLALMQLSREEFDLGDMLLNLCRNFEGLFHQKGVNLKFMGGSELIIGDRDKLSQLMVNLLSNSLKYTSPGGQVLLLVNGNTDFVHMVINDDGIGIPQNDIPRVFERLYRADTSRTRATGGAGIGLTIAKAIVQAHRGSINIVSQVGTGTEVTVVLPRKIAEESEHLK